MKGRLKHMRAIQSVQSFRTCTIRCSIGGWILMYTGVKIVAGLFLGLFVWFIMGSVSNAQLSLAALLPVLGAEYALFTFLPVQSIFNPLKYLNLFSYVHTSSLYTEYLNINMFGFPAGNRRMMLILLPALFTVLGASFFQWITPLIPVSAAELLLGLGQGKWWCVFAFAAWIAAGHAALKVCINSM